jgi:hypothetical protein
MNAIIIGFPVVICIIILYFLVVYKDSTEAETENKIEVETPIDPGFIIEDSFEEINEQKTIPEPKKKRKYTKRVSKVDDTKLPTI